MNDSLLLQIDDLLRRRLTEQTDLFDHKLDLLVEGFQGLGTAICPK